MALNLVRAACVGIGVAFSAAAAATDFGSIMGLWDFVLPETIAGTGPQGASTATSPEDFDPSRPGLELLAVGVTTGCADPQTFRYRETRQFLATDGIPLVTFEVPQINATVPACPVRKRPYPRVHLHARPVRAGRGTRDYWYVAYERIQR
jgi:hypothetical protein